MVRLRWTFALIIICVTLLATVITAFRIRDLQKSSHESVSEFKKRQKCEDCDVNKLDLDQQIPHKTESAKRSYQDLNKPAQEKKKSIDEKTFLKTKPVLEESNHVSDEDEADENLIYLQQLASKWEQKQIASGVISEKILKPINDKKKVITASSTSDIKVQNKIRIDSKPNDDEDDDDDDDDDKDGDGDNDNDKYDTVFPQKQPIIEIKKKTATTVSHKPSKNKQFKPLKPLLEDKDLIDDDKNEDDSDDDDGNEFIDNKVKTKEKVSKTLATSEEHGKHLKPIKQDKTVLKDKPIVIKAVEEVESKDSIKIMDYKEVVSKLEKSKDKVSIKLKVEDKSSISNQQIISTKLHRDSSEKPITGEGIPQKHLNEPLKDQISIKQKETTKDIKQVRDVENKKITELRDTETMSKEIQVEKDKIANREDTRLKHITEALNRRNLLKSEFEDFYAFLPTFAPNFTRVQNPECRRHGQILLRQLRGSKLWALNMLDATGKIPSGLLQGNGIQLGSFDQCLESRARVQLDTGSIVKVHGKYCLARIDLKAELPEMEVPVHLAQAKNLFKSRIDDPGHFVPRFSTLSWGVCVPAPCNPDDVENIVRDAIKHYQYTSGVSIRVKVESQDCQMQKKQAWWEEWLGIPTLLTLSLYGVVILLVLVATVQDFLARRKDEETAADETNGGDEKNSKNDKNNGQDKQPRADNVFRAFSLYRTVSKLAAPAASDEISCIHGVRGIATVALLVAHKFLPVAVMPYTNRLKISEIVSSPVWSWCRAGWMYTDCFLLLSGTLMAHRIANDSDTGALKRIFSRYLRLTPALLAVILFYAYIWDNVSTGPMWGSLITKNAEVCQQGWWWNIFYVQNYFGFENMCAPQTHQLALDMQLSILAGIMVWAMQSDMPVLRALLPTLHVWTAFSRYKTTKDHRLTLLAYHGVSVSQLYRTARLSYTSVIHRSTPYLVGLSLGLSLKNNTRHSKILMAFGWLIGGTLWALVWWAGYDSGSTQYRYNATFAAQYAALAPIASALAIAWLIYAVHGGHCEFLNKLLCSRPLALISRLSYALYLCQFVVFLTNAATVRNAREFSLMSLIDVQEISIIFLSSVLLTLTLVIPIQSLPKHLFLVLKSNIELEKRDATSSEKTQDQLESSRKNEKIMEPIIRSRQTLIAHREVLEEIPEVEIEYEHQRETNDGLEEILEEEEDNDDTDDERHLDEEDLEIIEEEQGAEEDFWINREDNAQRRSYSRNSDRDLDDWEITGNGNGRGGAQHYRYSRER